MANFTALKTAINNAIKTNGNEEITGAILQAILDAMVETLGDSAINDLENAITTEVTNRENAVGGVADDLAAEVQARQALDYNVNNRINAEEYNRQNADAALSQTMSQGFQTLGSQMTALNAAISALNAAYQNGYLYGGIATPSSSPSNNKCFYIALQGGTYTNFGGVGVVEGINIIKNDSGWKVEHIYDQTTLLNEFYLLRQQVIRAISSIDPIVIQGDVTNAPDEEDLTSDAQNLLKFKDRAYSPLNFSGLGMKILRKNIAPLSDSAAFNGFVEGVTAEETLAGTPELIFWDRMNTRFVGIKDGVYYLDWTDSDNYVPVSTSLVYMYNGTPYQWTGSDFIVDETEVPNLVNCLTQDMINEANTIYIIRYDYTLKEDITIPANCVLQFDGGSISGEHTITGDNTIIKAEKVEIFNGVSLGGTYNNEFIEAEWFSDISDAAAAAKATLLGFRLSKDVTLSAQLDLFDIRYVVIRANINNTESNALILGYDSRSGEYCKFEIQKVQYSRILAGKNMDVYIQEGTKLELYPDSTITNKTSIAYSRFFLGAIDNLYITGNANGWCNENTFVKGRFRYVYIAGDGYPHNNNIFYHPAIENEEGINIVRGQNNRFYDCRLEGSVHIQFGASTFGNKVYYSWQSIDVWSVLGWLPYGNQITNNGDSSNTVTTLQYEKEDTFVINKDTIKNNRNLKCFSIVDDSDEVRWEGIDNNGVYDLSHSSLRIDATMDFGLTLDCKENNGVLRWSACIYDTNGNVFKDSRLPDLFVIGGNNYNSETGEVYSNGDGYFTYIPVLITRIKRIMEESSLIFSHIQFKFFSKNFRYIFKNITITYLRPYNCYDRFVFKLNGVNGVADKIPIISSSYAQVTEPSYVIMDGEEVFCTQNNKMYKRVGDTLYTTDYSVVE